MRNSVLEDSTLTARKLADDQRVLCASPHYLERYGTPKTAADLEKHRLIGFRNMDAKVLTETNDCTAVFDPKRGTQKLVVNDGSTQRRLTREGAGISVNSAWLVHNDLADGSLIRLLPNYEFVDKPSLWLIYPKSNVVSAKVRVFIDYLIEHIGRPKMWGILN